MSEQGQRDREDREKDREDRARDAALMANRQQKEEALPEPMSEIRGPRVWTLNGPRHYGEDIIASGPLVNPSPLQVAEVSVVADELMGIHDVLHGEWMAVNTAEASAKRQIENAIEALLSSLRGTND